jgi:hypothetical protein
MRHATRLVGVVVVLVVGVAVGVADTDTVAVVVADKALTAKVAAANVSVLLAARTARCRRGMSSAGTMLALVHLLK